MTKVVRSTENKFTTKAITQIIVDSIKASERLPWQRPWHELGSHLNGSTGKQYRGINQVIMYAVATNNNYTSNVWLTQKQAIKLGGSISEENANNYAPLSFFKYVPQFLDKAKKKPKLNDKGKQIIKPMLTCFSVYNIELFDGINESDLIIPQNEILELSEEERIDSVESYTEAIDFEFKTGGNKAYYSPTKDYVRMPEFKAFSTSIAYYKTLLHELVHWTGHKERLGRDLMMASSFSFGDIEYSKEELTAEMGALFLSGQFGLVKEDEELDNSKAYLQGWCSKLESNPDWIVKASQAATKAQAYLNKEAKYKA